MSETREKKEREERHISSNQTNRPLRRCCQSGTVKKWHLELPGPTWSMDGRTGNATHRSKKNESLRICSPDEGEQREKGWGSFTKKRNNGN